MDINRLEDIIDLRHAAYTEHQKRPKGIRINQADYDQLATLAKERLMSEHTSFLTRVEASPFPLDTTELQDRHMQQMQAVDAGGWSLYGLKVTVDDTVDDIEFDFWE